MGQENFDNIGLDPLQEHEVSPTDSDGMMAHKVLTDEELAGALDTGFASRPGFEEEHNQIDPTELMH
ncbi:MAG: hypothetical protein Q7K40_03320 [bacterium]|nr:hypothetical protein [bacterium]